MILKFVFKTIQRRCRCNFACNTSIMVFLQQKNNVICFTMWPTNTDHWSNIITMSSRWVASGGKKLDQLCSLKARFTRTVRQLVRRLNKRSLGNDERVQDGRHVRAILRWIKVLGKRPVFNQSFPKENLCLPPYNCYTTTKNPYRNHV